MGFLFSVRCEGRGNDAKGLARRIGLPITAHPGVSAAMSPIAQVTLESKIQHPLGMCGLWDGHNAFG